MLRGGGAPALLVAFGMRVWAFGGREGKGARANTGEGEEAFVDHALTWY